MKILIVHNFYKTNNIGGEDITVETEISKLKSIFGNDRILIFSISNDNVSLLRFFFAPLAPFLTLFRLYCAIRQNNVSIVHVHNYFPLITPFSFIICKLAGAKVVHTLHNYRPWCLAGTFYRNGHGICKDCLTKNLLQGVLHKCYRNSFLLSTYMTLVFLFYRKLGLFNWPDRIFTVSKFQEQLVSKLNFFKTKIETKNNIISDLKPLEHSLSYGKETRKSYIFVGRIEESKGAYLLLSQWSKLPSDMELKVIGDGPDFFKFKQKFSQPNIVFLGKQSPSSVAAEMLKSRFLIQPSLWYETMGLTMLEAFQCGTPVLGFKLGTREEFISYE